MTVPTVSLPSGDEMSQVGFGTWNIAGEELRTALRAALDAGYTHVDTAEGYMNEAEIGEVIAEHDREDLFLTSKVLPKHLNYESVLASCEATLDRLGTDYLDLYLIHWPNPAISVRETFEALAKLRAEGAVRNVGVSNFSTYQLDVARHVADVPIAVNQIELHPWFYREDLVAYCRETDTAIQASAPLARTEILGDETLGELAEEYDRTPAQVALRWIVEKGITPLPRSTSADHIAENIDLFDWELSDEDHERIDGLDRDEPVYDTGVRDWDDDVWGISQ
ncbi:MAG: aldo/keto reductase [Halobacteriales archaeon]